MGDFSVTASPWLRKKFSALGIVPSRNRRGLATLESNPQSIYGCLQLIPAQKTKFKVLNETLFEFGSVTGGFFRLIF